MLTENEGAFSSLITTQRSQESPITKFCTLSQEQKISFTVKGDNL